MSSATSEPVPDPLKVDSIEARVLKQNVWKRMWPNS